MSLFAPVLTACLLASAPQGSDKESELRAYLEATYAHPEKVLARQFVADAVAANLITTVEDKVLAKRVLRMYHTKKGAQFGRRHGAGATEFGRHAASNSGLPGLTEVEYNDTIPYAQRIGGGEGTLDGELTLTGDDDTFHYVMVSPGLLSVSVVGDSLGDPNLSLFDANGNLVAFNDDAIGLDPSIDLFLPAGVFYFQVGGFLGDTGTYTLSATPSAFPNPVAPTGTLVNATLDTADGAILRLQLAEDSKVDMTFGGTLDLALEIILPSGASFFFIDDVDGLLPAYDSYLPAGLYFLRITEFTGSTGAYTYQIDTTPGIPAFPCGSTVTGNVPGAEGPAVYSLDVAAGGQAITATTSDPGSNSIGDTILFLFDANLQLLSSNDDIGGGNFFSEIATSLPAGRYYYFVTGFFGAAGDFDISGVCGPAPAPLPAVVGANTGEVVTPGQPVVFSLSVETPLPLTIAVDTPVGDLDPVLSVFDSNGRRIVFDDDGGPGLDSLGAARLAPGQYTILVRDFGQDLGPFELNIGGPLSWDGSRVPSGFGQENDLVALFAAAFPSPPLWILPGLTDGYLLLDPSTLLLIGTTTIGADGTYAFPAVPGFVPYVQALNFENGGFPATFSNRLPQ